jgi:hypothetical protein
MKVDLTFIYLRKKKQRLNDFEHSNLERSRLCDEFDVEHSEHLF